MRFRYFDSEGTEVRVSSVDALKFRISTGAVTSETLLYDSAVDEWAPAHEHQVFRFLIEEDDAAPPESAAADAEGEVQDLESEIRPTEGPEPADQLEAKDQPEAADDAEPAPSDEVAPTAGGEPTEAGEPTGASGSEAGDPPTTEKPPSPDDPLPLQHFAPTDDFASRKPSPPAADDPKPVGAAGSGASASPSDAQENRSSDRSRTRGEKSDRSNSRRSPPARGTARSSRVARRGRPLAWSLLAVLLVAVSGAVFLHLNEAGAGPLVPGSASPGGEIVPGGEATAPPGDGGVASIGPVEGVPATPPAGAAPEEGDEEEAAAEPARLAADVAAAASGDLAGAMTELQEALGVGSSPPGAWLQGAYLASAGDYPAVREYWQNYATYVASMRVLEEELFRGFVQNRVLKMGLDTAQAAGLSARVLQRYERSSDSRALVYSDLSELAAEALALHDTLAHRSDAISYEPFTGSELSRDPVIEAVADDPELGEHIWTRMDRMFDLLERVQGVGPVSTLRMQEALLGGLEIPDREG